jgi:UDP-glucose:(glucosyl)LPS alpha-1,2-glucosyltransferase
MSCIYRGSVVDTNLSRNARGGTEMMRERLLKAAPSELLEKFAIHLSRPREIYSDVKNILWAHDLAADPENKILLNNGWQKFEKIVFVTHWQRDQYISMYGIPYSKCAVIENAIETKFEYSKKPEGAIRFIYHTTPHRGLELLYPIFDALSKEYDNIHLDVFSSFEIYGWKERDKPYADLFEKLKSHPKISYHGSKSNEEVLSALKQSHIFLYPCIWVETSCIAMIEAIRSGVTVIHPSLGGLPETAADTTVMYDFTEIYSHHANMAYNITKTILNQEIQTPGFIDACGADAKRELSKNSIDNFKFKWTQLLTRMVQDG